LKKLKYPVAPLIIGLILGPMTENNLRKTLMLFRGDLTNFLDRPIALGFLAAFIAILVLKLVFRKRLAGEQMSKWMAG
jgi:putative tricarboxylic transport membrane protein